jgi:hypothetical protein
MVRREHRHNDWLVGDQHEGDAKGQGTTKPEPTRWQKPTPTAPEPKPTPTGEKKSTGTRHSDAPQ